jgi:hypothetical protein
MTRSIPFDRHPIRAALIAGPAVLALACTLPTAAQANLLQLVTTSFAPGGTGVPAAASDSDEVFVPTSADVTTNILAAVPGGAQNLGYFAQSSAGSFGQVGLSAGAFGVRPGSEVFSEVLIGSDEFVNTTGVPQHVQANFIVDGGSIADFFSTDTTVTFTLDVGAENVGSDGPEMRRAFAEAAIRDAATFGGAGGFFPGFEGGSYEAIYATDSSGSPSFADTFEGGLDLGAIFDPGSDIKVDIPLSLQSLDLGTVQPGDRLMLGYRAAFLIEQDGVSEGIFADFSDPLQLSNNSILSSLSFTPVDQPSDVPSPAGLPLLAGGLLVLLLRRLRGQVDLPAGCWRASR